jgi:hypothetical protein
MAAVAEVAVKPVVGEYASCWLSTRMTSRSGKLVSEVWVLPDEAADTPLKSVPVRGSVPPGITVASGPSSVGVQPGWAPRPSSYNSAEARELSFQSPPATSTLPDGKSVAVGDHRAVVRGPEVGAKVPATGSNNSAEAREAPLWPPATSTFPDGSSVAAWR